VTVYALGVALLTAPQGRHPQGIHFSQAAAEKNSIAHFGYRI
jgi:hypothetical protein